MGGQEETTTGANIEVPRFFPLAGTTTAPGFCSWFGTSTGLLSPAGAQGGDETTEPLVKPSQRSCSSSATGHFVLHG